MANFTAIDFATSLAQPDDADTVGVLEHTVAHIHATAFMQPALFDAVLHFVARHPRAMAVLGAALHDVLARATGDTGAPAVAIAFRGRTLHAPLEACLLLLLRFLHELAPAGPPLVPSPLLEPLRLSGPSAAVRSLSHCLRLQGKSKTACRTSHAKDAVMDKPWVTLAGTLAARGLTTAGTRTVLPGSGPEEPSTNNDARQSFTSAAPDMGTLKTSLNDGVPADTAALALSAFTVSHASVFPQRSTGTSFDTPRSTPQRAKSHPCWYWMARACDRGLECHFGHEAYFEYVDRSTCTMPSSRHYESSDNDKFFLPCMCIVSDNSGLCEALLPIPAIDTALENFASAAFEKLARSVLGPDGRWIVRGLGVSARGRARECYWARILARAPETLLVAFQRLVGRLIDGGIASMRSGTQRDALIAQVTRELNICLCTAPAATMCFHHPFEPDTTEMRERCPHRHAILLDALHAMLAKEHSARVNAASVPASVPDFEASMGPVAAGGAHYFLALAFPRGHDGTCAVTADVRTALLSLCRLPWSQPLVAPEQSDKSDPWLMLAATGSDHQMAAVAQFMIYLTLEISRPSSDLRPQWSKQRVTPDVIRAVTQMVELWMAKESIELQLSVQDPPPPRFLSVARARQ